MKSKVIKWYDYKLEVIPEENLKWRITDEEIFSNLEKYSQEYAREEDVQCVEMNDSVKCSGVSNISKWNRSNVLFYPGRGLCDKALEDACLGKKLNETYKVQLDDGEVTFKVDRIVRRSSMPIDDSLIKLLKIEHVNTIEDYASWYRKTNEDERRMMASYKSAYYLLEKICEKSTYEIDSDEQYEWTYNRAKMMYDALLKSGADPRIPKEGFVFLTEEEAIENIRVTFKELFIPYFVSYQYLLENHEKSIEEIIERGMGKLANSVGISVEELKQTSDEQFLKERIFTETTLECLIPYTVNCLEA